MPYKLEGNCVKKADTGETIKCHETHAKALAHLRALEINVSDVHKEIGRVVAAYLHPVPEHRGFAIKEYNGKYRWVAIASGAYGPDRDGHWVTEKALETWADGLQPNAIRANGEPVVARWWHVGKPNVASQTKGFGLDLGIADTAIFHNHSLILSGTFHYEDVGRGFANTKKSLGLSVAFFHPVYEPVEKQFHQIDIYEVSLLPNTRASYPLTALAITEGV
jgi:hypothetical protein